MEKWLLTMIAISSGLEISTMILDGEAAFYIKAKLYERI
jgi:hypothetical protein